MDGCDGAVERIHTVFGDETIGMLMEEQSNG